MSNGIADTLARLARAEANAVREAATRLADERALGHTGLRIDRLGGSGWDQRLRASGLTGDGSGNEPLVLRHGLLRFARDARAEATIAARLRAVLAEPGDEHGADILRPRVAALFPGAATEVNWQAIAAASALRRKVCVIAGGPGTGKTTTVLRVLALLLEREPHLRIALAAPTGKAAARLAESIHHGAASLPAGSDDGRLGAALPTQAVTLHRLLGFDPLHNHFRHHADRPLAADVVVVDELSMADLLVVRGLIAATTPATRLILLGDGDQLASVEAGYVLGDLCRAAGDALAPEPAAWAQRLGLAVPAASMSAPPLSELVVRLRRTWRFGADSGITAMASAIRTGDAAAVRAAVAAQQADCVVLDRASGPAAVLDAVLPAALACTHAADPATALTALAAVRILAATRQGPWGVRAMDALCEHRLHLAGAPEGRGRPVLITANDPHLGLANGDLGVTWRTAEDGDVVVFATPSGLKTLATQRIPPHESAWAMTIHKAQGSEYDHVLVVLPPDDGPWLTRELLYTAITRARHHVTLVASTDQLSTAAGRSAVRATGLAAELA